MLRLPGVTSSAAHQAYVQIRTRYGGRRARRMHGGTSGNDETDLSRSEGASSSVECKPGSQNVSPPSGPQTDTMRPYPVQCCLKGAERLILMILG